MRETLDVIYQSDDKYALITAISIISLLENNKEFTYVNIRILEYKITCQNKDKIKKNTKIL
ncbi:MAG: hypothetical protein LBT69_01225 [Lactobacillales bacterium]|jgi:lipopolysaccharide biosynthesis glycosyltransferase|nr:hypothetical protein [Lactobacillales bacterium]